MGVVSGNDWVDSFLNAPVKGTPGEAFEYNSMNTYLLSAIIQERTGMKMVDYLRPRLFEPRRSIFGEVKDTNKRGQCQIYSNIAERKYLRQAKDTKSRKQCKLICFLPRRNILGAAKVRSPFVSPRPAEDVPEAAGGAMPPSA